MTSKVLPKMSEDEEEEDEALEMMAGKDAEALAANDPAAVGAATTPAKSSPTLAKAQIAKPGSPRSAR